MKTTSPSDFAKQMLLLSRPASQFQPSVTYDPDGDCIEFISKPDAFYAERVDDLVTVYYSQETGDLIGSLIKDVSKFCGDVASKFPGFKIEIHDGPVRLDHIFLAGLWTSERQPEELATLVYRKLIVIAEEADAVVDSELCV